MTRVIAGKAKGRKLVVPAAGTRPTSDRIRESIFARLESWGVVEGSDVADLFAGSGALGIEALSRGAARATFVDASGPAVGVLKKNLATTGFQDVARVIRKKVLSGLHQLSPGVRFDLVFMDPPYDLSETELQACLEALLPHLAPDAVVVVERSSFSPEPTLPEHYYLERHRRWGDTAAWFLSRVGESP